MSDDQWLMGRQPILDRGGSIFAYELLFRSPRTRTAEFADPSFATANVILGAVSGFGMQELLGGHRGFVNVGRDLLFSDTLEILPRDQVVLDQVFAMPMAELVSRLRLSADVGAALATRAGPLGALLDVAERLEHLDVDAAEAAMTAAGIPRERADDALRLAYSWRSGMG